jgi:hypothetical protein
MGIIWGNRKLFSRNDRGFRLALKHALLVNRPVIGRGAYSVILAGEASVFKLTIDGAAYALAEQQSSWRSSALPEIRALHGTVGVIDCAVPIYLFEMEHLDRLMVGSAERKTCLAIARQLRPFYKDGMTSAERLRHVGARQSDTSLAQGLGLLAGFLEPRWPAVDLDLHSANFMRRPKTGEAVIADPFMDMETRALALKHYALGLPEGTVIL